MKLYGTPTYQVDFSFGKIHIGESIRLVGSPCRIIDNDSSYPMLRCTIDFLLVPAVGKEVMDDEDAALHYGRLLIQALKGNKAE